MTGAGSRIDTPAGAIYREGMEEYEALARAAVAALQAANQPKWTDVLAAVGGVGVGLLQCGLIYIGLRRMGEAAADRKAQHEETMATLHVASTAAQRQHEESMATLHAASTAAQRQHEESMTALKSLIERTVPRR